MKQNITYILKTLALAAILLSFATTAKAQTAADSMDVSFTSIKADSVADNALSPIKADSVYKVKRDWSTWRPNPKRAMWLAIVLPGAGQIYNRKYWKLPIVYGGFVGCIYAMRWNNQMYTDYSQAYLDLMDDDPNTQSYNQFLHLGAKIDESNIQRYQTLFKKRKDKFRRWRDLSFFCLVGVYALSIVDAYVDASLSEFDISKDLSLKLEPTIINDNRQRNPFKANSLGLSCSLNF
ncbi:MAG: DUF5683 domain-containing protein [Prevotella stercorea]|uniref:DUF5683 domain-containing protein n=1 Tax=Leyella stercorea TaxID=363265 RepID=UPI001F3DBF12|nr:hypothetical protein [Leyella stercorea]MCI6131304.1 DUF5683 domain-containing protein [Prevotella sp.]MCI6342590.1 DUF5683 domain-containing protein [Prevotella sp.]MCI6489705.1 DUF5683 domain-containing protein [Prevotella sp.]MCI6687973.1 DUF5683 domain-containing protein [Prevotella sp.]